MSLPRDFCQTATERFETEAVPHLPALKRLALHLARNKEEAEDLVQETFAQALKSFDRYESGTNCRAWLCKIMFYKRSQWVRANRRYSYFDDGETDFPAAAPALPADYISEKLASALRDVPEQFRRVLWLAQVEEYTYREIAESTGVAIGTVMSRLHRGRKMLAANFNQNVARPNRQSVYN